MLEYGYPHSYIWSDYLETAENIRHTPKYKALCRTVTKKQLNVYSQMRKKGRNAVLHRTEVYPGTPIRVGLNLLLWIKRKYAICGKRTSCTSDFSAFFTSFSSIKKQPWIPFEMQDCFDRLRRTRGLARLYFRPQFAVSFVGNYSFRTTAIV